MAGVSPSGRIVQNERNIMRKMVVSRGVATAAVAAIALAGSGAGALAATELSTTPAPALRGITGALNANCSKAFPSNRYKSAVISSGCSLTFPTSEFPSGTPLLVGNALRSTIVGEYSSSQGGTWTITVNMSAPSILVFTITPTD
jgi:hypothetical protein